MVFDFESYLERLDPTQTYAITRLTGGVVNVTVRAVKTASSLVEAGRFPNHKTIILKYAPPFIAGVGEHAPMTRKRQQTEVKALSLFTRNSPLDHIQEAANVKVPDLLYHDLENHVIILSDLGLLLTLSETFNGLGGWVSSDAPPQCFNLTASSAAHDIPPEQTIYFSSTGSCLGAFFAYIHSSLVTKSIIEHPEMGESYLDVPSMQNIVLDYGIKPIQSHLRRFLDLVGSMDDAEDLYQRIERNWLRPTHDDERSFALGDCWTGAVLVSPSPNIFSEDTISQTTAQVNKPRVCVIDFEFANLGRGLHGDIAQLFAHLECFSIASRFHESTYHSKAIALIMASFIKTYKAINTRTDASRWPWYDGGTQRPDPTSVKARILRSALLTMAAEVMNVAFWKVWPCGNNKCPGADANTTVAISGGTTVEDTSGNKTTAAHDLDSVHLCTLIRRMACYSIWLTQRAGSSEEEMCRERNWNELILGPPEVVHESPRQAWLLDLLI